MDVNDGEMTQEEIEAEIRHYEQKFGMTSEEFLELRERREAPDEAGIIAWAILLKYRKVNPGTPTAPTCTPTPM